ncbi:MAG: hypothetical protein WD063_20875 [Pirellulales bacterium]
MILDLPENDRDDEILDDNIEPTSPAEDNRALEDNVAAEDEIAAEVPTEGMVDVSSANLDDGVTGSPTLPPADAQAAESLADLSAGQDASIPAEAQSDVSPAPSTQTDWSNFVPAPGYADPETGRPRFLTGRVDQAGFELRELVYGRRPIFDAETIEPGAGQPPQPPSLLSPPSSNDAAPPFFPRDNAGGGASPTVSVDVLVSLTGEAMEQVSKGSVHKAAEFSRGEVLVVGRKLFELNEEVKAREQQRRVLWGR